MEKDNKYINKINYHGNENILNFHKTAFLCSRKYPSNIILKTLDWAKEKKDKGNCVISCFHSLIEKDVFNILLRGKQPIILVLARGMKKKWSIKIKYAIEKERLLIISPFEDNIKYITQETANFRNKFMTELADEIFIPYCTIGGNLEELIKTLEDKKISTFI